MAQEKLDYTIPADNSGNNGSQVDLTFTYDPGAANPDGSFTVTNATGTYDTLDSNGNVVDRDMVTGLESPSTGYATPDNELFIGTTPFVTANGITFTIDNTSDSNDGKGAVNFYAANATTYHEDWNDIQVAATSVTESAVTCFASGTKIRTISGDIPVEKLWVGDLVATSTGAFRAIRWIGHRTIDCRRHPRPHDVYPVRIRAGAFGLDAAGEAMPARELRLSPGHPVLVGSGADEILVPIMCLINGTSVARTPVDDVTYWHVELEGAHDILLAEGLPAESYLDWGDRPFFVEASDHALHAPDHVVPGLSARCRPVASDGLLVEAERRRLDALFATCLEKMCSWPSVDDGYLAF